MQAQWGRAASWAVSIVGMAIVVAAASTAGHPGTTDAALVGPPFSVSPAAQTVPLSGGTASVDIQVSSVGDDASFQFTLRYDPGVLKNPQPQPSTFLSSTGRSVSCQAPIIDGSAGAGTVVFGCGTLGNQPGATANGATTIASVAFDLAGGAQTSIGIERATLSDTTGLTLCVANPNAPRSNSDWLNTCPVQSGAITVSGGDPTKDQGLSASPTLPPQPTDPPGAPTSTPGPGTPTVVPTQPAPGSSPAVTDSSSGRPSTGGSGSASGTGVISGSSSGAGGASGSAGGAQAAGHAGVGKFGTGPEPQHHGMPGASVWALAAGGIALTAAGVFMRRRTMR